MYQKKDYLFSESLGVCQVIDIVKLAAGKSEPVMYYVLRTVDEKRKTSYIPVEHHSVTLRNLISKEEALKKKASEQEISDIEKKEIKFVLNDKKL